MAVMLRRPILVGGLGLTLLVWLLESLNHLAVEVGGLSVIGAIAIGAGIWSFQRQASKQIDFSQTVSLDRNTVEQALAEVEAAIKQLAVETVNVDAKAELVDTQHPLQQKLTQLTAQLDRQEIRIAVIGGKATGKTALTQVLSSWVLQLPQRVHCWDTPELFSGSETGLAAEAAAWNQAIASDLVLFLITGDLTDSEFQILKQLAAVNQRTLLVFNKQDQYLPTERLTVFKHLQERVQEVVPVQDVVAIAAAPGAVKVRQHQPDGSVQEWMEQPTPEMALLSERLTQMLQQEGQQLIWANVQRGAIALKAEVKAGLNSLRRDRSLPLIEQFQWIAAATAFANPVPALDLLAAAAINTQLVLDLGVIYQQKFSLQQAQTVAGTLASLMLKLGLVELSTQTIGTVLKSNAITFVAGGAVQGVSAAYLTRLAGLSLIEYFQEQALEVNSVGEAPLSLERLSQTLRAVFQQNQQANYLKSFVQQTLDKLSRKAPPLELPGSESQLVQLTSPEARLIEENRAVVSLSTPSLESSSLLST